MGAGVGRGWGGPTFQRRGSWSAILERLDSHRGVAHGVGPSLRPTSRCPRPGNRPADLGPSRRSSRAGGPAPSAPQASARQGVLGHDPVPPRVVAHVEGAGPVPVVHADRAVAVRRRAREEHAPPGGVVQREGALTCGVDAHREAATGPVLARRTRDQLATSAAERPQVHGLLAAHHDLAWRVQVRDLEDGAALGGDCSAGLVEAGEVKVW